MYEFISGPLAVIAILVFVVGSVWKIGSMIWLARKDKIVYPYMDWKFGLRSLMHHMIPFASTNMRKQPEMTVTTFAFHIGLVLMPFFLLPHVILIQQALGTDGWWTLPKGVADALTVIVIFAGIVFLIRRLSNPVLRFVSYPSDYVLLLIAVAPFITGFLAYHHLLPYKEMSMLHMLTGEIMLIAIPFTRLSHMLYFAFTRAYMGCEFGKVRNSKDW